MSPAAESVILCEGFHDRAFWKGWLEHLGCVDARPRRGSALGPAVDPFGKQVAGGHFALHTPSRAFVRVRPCNGDHGVLDQITIRLKERSTQALRRLVINLDTDAESGDEDARLTAGLLQSIEQRVNAAGSAWMRLGGGELALDAGATLVSVVLWSVDEPPAAHLPEKQTLERLVCAALCAAYPDRAGAVATWLASRPAAPAAGPKEHAWSHMAGWYGAQGCDDFYQALWRDPAVAAELRRRLEATGAWRTIEALARE